MHLTGRLLQHSARILLLTRPRCGLCDVAKAVIQDVGKSRHFDYQEIDIMKKGQEHWKAMYQYEIPVIHVQRVVHTYAKPDVVTDRGKLFHRLGMT